MVPQEHPERDEGVCELRSSNKWQKERGQGHCKWLLVGLILIGLASGSALGEDRILVVASIDPLADFARRVGGDQVEVLTLVPPGASPHTYELKPSQVTQVARANLLVLNGVGFEYWADKLVKAVDNPELVVVDTSKGISILEAGNGEEATRHGGHGHPGGNPHIWLDPRQAMIQVGHIRDALIRADPDHAAIYRENSTRFLSELEDLDREIVAEVEGWRSRQFIAFHPAWIYFARRYGLEQVGVIEASPGREPSPVELARIVRTAKRIGATAIFGEPQFSSKAAEIIAHESGAQVLLLDPLGSTLKDRGYIAMMRYNVARMASALR